MRRRDFMAQSIGASLLAYLTGSGAVVAAGNEGRQAPGRLAALNPVSEYAKRYARPEGTLDSSPEQSLTFDILGWKTDKSRQIADVVHVISTLPEFQIC